MSRIRSVHPGLFTDEAFVSCSHAARLFVIGLWTECDDQGVFEWKPLQLKMRLFPADNVDVVGLLAEIEAGCLCRQFVVDGRKYGAIRNFGRYQRPRKPNAIHPVPDELRGYLSLGHHREDVVPQKSEPDDVEDASVPQKSELPPQMEDGGGKRETASDKPEAGRAPAKRGTRLATDFVMPDEWKEWAGNERHWGTSDIETEAAIFRDHWHTKPGKDGVKLDWEKTWHNWVRNSRRPNGTASTGKPAPIPEQIASFERSAAMFEKLGRAEDADEFRRKAAQLRGARTTGPPRSIGQLAGGIVKQAGAG